MEAMDVLKNVEGLAFCQFDDGDVVRHHLVQRIVRAYDQHKEKASEQLSLLETKAAEGNEAAPPTYVHRP